MGEGRSSGDHASGASAALPGVAFDAHQQADADHDRHHRRSAIAEERQRDADHGREAHDHQHVDRDVEEDDHGEPAARQLAEAAWGVERDCSRPAQQQGEHHDHEQSADQPPFLCHGGEDEIGMAFGQVIEMALRSLQIALAADTARSDRDLGLADMIAGAQRIAFRIEEDKHAVLLIFLEQEEEGEGHERRTGKPCADEQPDRHAGEEHHGDPAGHHRDGGA